MQGVFRDLKRGSHCPRGRVWLPIRGRNCSAMRRASVQKKSARDAQSSGALVDSGALLPEPVQAGADAGEAASPATDG
jgi:hypothetical protein